MSNPKTSTEWQQTLSPEQYHICREKGTEAPFSGKYNHHKDNGVYQCQCCGADLFQSANKYDSGSGWPSFYQAMPGQITEHTDNSLGISRTEITCKYCDAHLGHAFTDGPTPTGLRYCINSVSLQFKTKPKG